MAISDNSRKESPAEHAWRVAIIAMTLHRELDFKIDNILPILQTWADDYVSHFPPLKGFLEEVRGDLSKS